MGDEESRAAYTPSHSAASRPQLSQLATTYVESSPHSLSPGMDDTPSTTASSVLHTPSSSVGDSRYHAKSPHFKWRPHQRSSLSTSTHLSHEAANDIHGLQQLQLQPEIRRSGSEQSPGSGTGDDLFSQSSTSRQSSCETDVDNGTSATRLALGTQISTSPPKIKTARRHDTATPTPSIRRRAVEISAQELLHRLESCYAPSVTHRQANMAHRHVQHIVGTSADHAVTAGVNSRVQTETQIPSAPIVRKCTNTAPNLHTSVTAAPATQAQDSDSAPVQQIAPSADTPPTRTCAERFVPQESDSVAVTNLSSGESASLPKAFDTSSSIPPLVLDLRPIELFAGHVASQGTEVVGHVFSSVNLSIPGLILRRWAKTAGTHLPVPPLRTFVTTPMSKRRFSDVVSAAINSRASSFSETRPTSGFKPIPDDDQAGIDSQYWQADIVVLCNESDTSIGKHAINASPIASSSKVLIDTLEKTPYASNTQARTDRGGGLYYLRANMASVRSSMEPAFWSTGSEQASVEQAQGKHVMNNLSAGTSAKAAIGRSKSISARARTQEEEHPSSHDRPSLARLSTANMPSRQGGHLTPASSARRSPSALKLHVNTGVPRRSATLSSFPRDISSPGEVTSQWPTQSLQSLCRAHAQLPPSRAAFGDMNLAPGARGTFSFEQAGEATPKVPLEMLFDISTILPDFLYLGPAVQNETDVTKLHEKGVERVLNVAAEIEDAGTRDKFDGYLKLPMLDSVEATGVQDSIRRACEFLDDARLRSKSVYVHCKAGKSRSVTIVIAYLIHALRWPLNKAYAHVVERRSAICPNIGFVAELMKYEERELSVSRSSGIVQQGQHQDVSTGPGEASRSTPSLISPSARSLTPGESTAGDIALTKSSPDLASQS